MRQVPVANAFSFTFILPFFLVIIIDAMSFGIVTPVLASLVNQTSLLGGNDLYRHMMYGALQAIAPLCYMIGAPLLGYFSDRLGRKKILLYCTLGSLLGLIGYTAAFMMSSLLILFISRIIVGATTGSLAVAQAAIADVSSGSEKAKNIGIIAVAMTIGLVAGPLLGGVFSDPSVVSWFNDTTPFYVGIFLTLINLIILWCFLKENRPHPSPPKQAGEGTRNTFFNDILALYKLKALRWILLTFFVFELGWSLYYSSLALLLIQDFHASNKIVGIFSSYVGLLLSFWLIIGVRFLVKRFTLKNIVIPSLCVGAIVLLLAFKFNSLTVQWIIAIGISFSVAPCYSILITLASDQLPSREQGLLMGATDSLLSLAFAITGFLSGILALHNAALPELIAGIFFIISAIIFYIIKRGVQ